MSFIDHAWKSQHQIENHLSHISSFHIAIAFSFLIFIVFHLSICKNLLDLFWFFIGLAVLISSVVFIWLSTFKQKDKPNSE